MSANTTKTASVWKNNFHPTPQDWKSPPAAVFVPQKPFPTGSVPKNAKLSPVLKNFHPPPHDWKSVHDCAATGIYVGGPGSRANIEATDVVRNGNGNTRARRGIPRGHSGVYLEQGNARIFDCNISNNSLTGISAVSPDNAILNLEETDLVQNGTFQLEMPPLGSIARRESITQDNRLAAFGLTRARSGLVPDE